MAAGIVDVLELVEVDEKQRAAVLVNGDIGQLDVEFFHESTPVVQSGQVVVIRELHEHRVTLAQCSCRGFQRFHDIGNLPVFCRLELDLEIPARKLLNRVLQIRDRRECPPQGSSTVQRKNE